MPTLTAFLTALPELLTLAYQLISLWKEAKLKGWVEEGRKLSQTISEAKTDEERAELARRLFDRKSSV